MAVRTELSNARLYFTRFKRLARESMTVGADGSDDVQYPMPDGETSQLKAIRSA